MSRTREAPTPTKSSMNSEAEDLGFWRLRVYKGLGFIGFRVGVGCARIPQVLLNKALMVFNAGYAVECSLGGLGKARGSASVRFKSGV